MVPKSVTNLLGTIYAVTLTDSLISWLDLALLVGNEKEIFKVVEEAVRSVEFCVLVFSLTDLIECGSVVLELMR
jgi:hypothetical protein